MSTGAAGPKWKPAVNKNDSAFLIALLLVKKFDGPPGFQRMLKAQRPSGITMSSVQDCGSVLLSAHSSCLIAIAASTVALIGSATVINEHVRHKDEVKHKLILSGVLKKTENHGK